MLILAKKYGNHSNRLFQNLHFEAYAKEYGLTFYNPTFFDLAHLYNIKTNRYDYFLYYFFKFLARGNDFEEIKEEKLLSAKKRQKKILFVSGWDFRVDRLTTKYKSFFQEKYSLKSEIVALQIKSPENNLSDILTKINSSEVSIGVHLRKGDYASWGGGKYYYADSTYASVLTETKKLFIDKDICVICFSDENVNLSVFADMTISNNTWFIDHHLMSLCDFLIGPPSTFSMWASYVSKKMKYFHMVDDKSYPKHISDFVRCNG